MIYLASPYSSPSSVVREARYRLVCRMAARLMREEHADIFCPIAHSHGIAIYGKLASDFAFWLAYDKRRLLGCTSVWVAAIPGVGDSLGVRAEMDMAEGMGLPIRFVPPRAEELEAYDEWLTEGDTRAKTSLV